MDNLFEKLKNASPLIMGIVNVTPDSFSDGGDFNTVSKAFDHGQKLIAQGADILDIGGESTRPNADVVSVEEEVARVVPVIKALSTAGAPYISIDTRNARTMEAALGAGANIINDVSALTHDPDSLSVAAKARVPVCLMHMKGTPQTMQNAPTYDNVIDEINAYFENRLQACERAGLSSDKIILDPGIGFGKTLEHNLEILHKLKSFRHFGCPVLLGASRKSFIGMIDAAAMDAKHRLGGSIAAAIYGAHHGEADIIRVHDVAQTRQALSVYKSISSA